MTITKENVDQLIRSGDVYPSETPSKWARFEVNAPRGIDPDDIGSFTHAVDLPEVQPLLDELKSESQARAAFFQGAYDELTRGMRCIRMANNKPRELREKYNLYASLDCRDAKTVLSAEGSEGLWGHGWTVIARDIKTGRIHATYGGCFDIWVSAGDMAWEIAE